MKAIMYAIIFCLISLHCLAQEASQTAPAPGKYEYCELIGTHRAFTQSKVSIVLDFGEGQSGWKDARLRDEQTNKVKVFNSMIDALNYMTEFGWEFVQAYSISEAASGGNTYRWILRREKSMRE